MTTLSQLDSEHRSRIRELSRTFEKERPFDLRDIFSHTHVCDTLVRSKVILAGYNLERILSAYPFSSSIYVSICPNCPCVKSFRDFDILHSQGAIVPIMAMPYAHYPVKFAKRVLEHPHISAHEARFYRFAALAANANEFVCNHCVEERRREYGDIIRQGDFPPEALELLDDFFGMLFPYMDPDYELLEHFGDALKQDDREKLRQIHFTGKAIWEARTTQAFMARSSIPSSCIPSLIRESENVLPELKVSELSNVETALANQVHFDIPENVDVGSFLECIGPYRDELAGIVDSIIEEASDNPSNYLTSLTSTTAALAEETRRLSRHKRLLFFRASCSFIANNKVLLASGLMATMFGVTGNPLGCCLSIASGTGAHIGKKTGKLRMQKDAQTLIDEVKHSVRPYVHKLLAKYLNIDIRAVQLWDIRSELQAASCKTKSAPSKRSARRRRA